MVRAGSSPGGWGPASTPMWLLPPALVAVCTAVAVSFTPSMARVQVAWLGIIATAAVAAAAGAVARRGRSIDELRRQYAEREATLYRHLADQEAETVRMAKETLPAAMGQLQQGAPAEEVLHSIVHESRVSPEFEAAHEAVLRYVLQAVEAEEGLRDSAQRAFVNIARRVQAIVHQQAQDLREMEDKHGQDPDVFGDLLHLDHGTALIGRLADSIAVLGGARPGRQWQQDVPLFNVLRGAMSRIIDYRRVDLHSVAEVGVLGRAVEPLIHALSELLDNATRYSPPQTRVHLTATEIQSGVAIEIEDAGVGLTDEARIRAERALAQNSSSGLDLNDLGESPRLGLAVVGRLSHTNDFKVSLRVSAYGGVRVVLVVPPDLLTATPAPGGAVAKAATLPPPKPRTRPGARRPETATEDPVGLPAQRNSNGLPQRRRRARTVSPHRRSKPASTAGPKSPASADPPAQAGIWLAAFQEGVSGESPPPAGPDGLRSNESEK
ncbi:sensor histidine kinase [Streptomyces gobiensis]|uniref:sensor histidine kinase n=1 Tax=Streptomyces gobiensis TaxID=2875706 RepID=UPI001E388204|nr:ATP-binding protein [Streptomyces gobiensis]UGY94503.1 ATP-binding protein [Streptomyces gobiensis]